MATAPAYSPIPGHIAHERYYESTSIAESKTVANITDLLPEFPSQYVGDRVWTGGEMVSKESEYIIKLSDQDLLHILDALKHFQSLDLGPGQITHKTFPLPAELKDRLRKISQDCYRGRGFCVLRGLRPETLTEEENVFVFAGLAAHVAPIRGFQDLNREMVACHVISQDLEPDADEQNLRPAFTNGPVSFHTDVGDILTLFTMDVPSRGGETMVVSSSKVYNEMAIKRPDLLQELSKDWTCFHAQDYETDGTPLINHVSGDRLVLQYSRLPVTGFRNEKPSTALPPPTPRRLQAMDMLEALSWKHAFPLPRIKGDIAFINNLCMMHARKPFDTTADGKPLPSKRHLVKLMLRDPKEAWNLPKSMDWMTKRVYGPNEADGTRTEKWQVTLDGEKPFPNGKIWVGTGGLGNG